MKQAFKTLLFALMVQALVLWSTSSLAKEIEVDVNDKKVNFDVAPQVVSNRTMIPLRATLESLGADVEWNQETKTATGITDKYTLNLKINNNRILKLNNLTGRTEIIQMDVNPSVINGRTLVPVRFMAESLNNAVVWDNENRKVLIHDLDYFTKRLKINAPAYYDYTQKCLNEDITRSINRGKYTLTVNVERMENEKLIKEQIKFNITLNIENDTFEAHFDAYSKSINSLIDLLTDETSLPIDSDDLKFDLYYDGEKFFITSPLFKDREFLHSIGMNYRIQNGLVQRPSEKVRNALNAALLSFGEGNEEDLALACEKILCFIDTPEKLDSSKNAIDLLGYLYSDNYFKVSPDAYTFKISDVEELKKTIDENDDHEVWKLIKNLTKCNINFTQKIKENKIASASGSYEFEFLNPKDNIEKINIKLTAKEDKNNSYEFEMPNLFGVFDFDTFQE